MYSYLPYTARLYATLSRRFSSTVGPVEVRIRSILTDRFKCKRSLAVLTFQGLETHFKITIVSQYFEELSLMERQRLIYKALKNEFESGLHALSVNVCAMFSFPYLFFLSRLNHRRNLSKEIPSPPCPSQRPNKSSD
ncbi:hypothetical protein AHF37_02821 [Paragonimus kellicotti]|nr:hypothetical protein AHF37_02821 [Paragonimus kellicotti]